MRLRSIYHLATQLCIFLLATVAVFGQPDAGVAGRRQGPTWHVDAFTVPTPSVAGTRHLFFESLDDSSNLIAMYYTDSLFLYDRRAEVFIDTIDLRSIGVRRAASIRRHTDSTMAVYDGFGNEVIIISHDGVVRSRISVIPPRLGGHQYEVVWMDPTWVNGSFVVQTGANAYPSEFVRCPSLGLLDPLTGNWSLFAPHPGHMQQDTGYSIWYPILVNAMEGTCWVKFRQDDSVYVFSGGLQTGAFEIDRSDTSTFRSSDGMDEVSSSEYWIVQPFYWEGARLGDGTGVFVFLPSQQLRDTSGHFSDPIFRSALLYSVDPDGRTTSVVHSVVKYRCFEGLFMSDSTSVMLCATRYPSEAQRVEFHRYTLTVQP